MVIFLAILLEEGFAELLFEVACSLEYLHLSLSCTSSIRSAMAQLQWILWADNLLLADSSDILFLLLMVMWK
jgi:hypothetical protein